jgi:hypothetical protein
MLGLAISVLSLLALYFILDAKADYEEMKRYLNSEKKDGK